MNLWEIIECLAKSTESQRFYNCPFCKWDEKICNLSEKDKMTSLLKIEEQNCVGCEEFPCRVCLINDRIKILRDKLNAT